LLLLGEKMIDELKKVATGEGVPKEKITISDCGEIK